MCGRVEGHSCPSRGRTCCCEGQITRNVCRTWLAAEPETGKNACPTTGTNACATEQRPRAEAWAARVIDRAIMNTRQYHPARRARRAVSRAVAAGLLASLTFWAAFAAGLRGQKPFHQTP